MTNTNDRYIIGNPRKGRNSIGDVRDDPMFNDIMKLDLSKVIGVPEAPKIVNPISSGIVDFRSFWRIPGVHYRGEIYEVDLMKSLLANNSIMNQDGWADYSREAKSKNDFHTPDFPLLYGVIKAFSLARNDPLRVREVAEAQILFKDNIIHNMLMTLTRVRYDPDARGLVIHNYGMNNSSVEAANITGPDGEISASRDSDTCESLLGTDNVSEINDVFKWLGEKNVSICRVAQTFKSIEMAARLNYNLDSVNLYCCGDLTFSHFSLGVRLHKIIGGTK